jgi:site-specific DNA-methyltransferase (adenine-specific)
VQGRKSSNYGHVNPDHVTESNGERYPVQTLEFAAEKGIHPTQKPVALFEYLIRTYTQPGETVLDNCMGSGTTAIAAERSGRRWIGIERDEGYYNAALARIYEAVTQPAQP